MQSTHFNLFRKSLSSYDAVANDVVETLELSNEEIETELLDALYAFMENAAAGVNQQNQNCLSWIQSNVQPMKPLLEQARETYKQDSTGIMAGGPSAMLANPAQRTRYAAKHLIMGILQVC